MLLSIIDMFLGEGKGNSSAATIESKLGKRGALFEVLFVAEIVSPKYLFIDRYFPQEPIRVVVDHTYKDFTKKCTKSMFAKELEDIIPEDMLCNINIKTEIIPKMLEKAKQIAQLKLDEIIEYSIEDMEDAQNEALSRVKYLKEVNNAINDEEITAIHIETTKLTETINSARLRVDAVRFVGVVDFMDKDE